MLQTGDDFAGYRIERLLGAGGMGEVYVARHPRLPRSDALKVLPPQFASDPQFRARFEREADLASSLSHPAIVKVFDRGEFEGRLWIAMELVDGLDLSRRLREQGRLAPKEVADSIGAVAGALDYAADRGLVHRDVKPANILLSTDGHVMLTDFGIARMGSETSELTGTGVTVGTLSYASPEQLRGEQLDGRSDQYSLACTAYQLLVGEAPFQNSNAAIVIGSHLTSPPPSAVALRPELSPDVDDALRRALSKSPADRFDSSADFAAALDAGLRETAIAAPPTVSPAVPPVAQPRPADDDPDRTLLRGEQQPLAAPADSRPRGRRKRNALAAAAVVVLLVVVAGGYAGYRWVQSDDPTSGLTQAPTAEAAAMPRTSVSPLLPSLENKPEGWRWRVTTGPTTPTFLAADEKTAVFKGGTYDQPLIIVVDPATGKIRREPIPYDGADYKCALRASKLACADSPMGSSAWRGTVLDVETGALTRLGEVPGPGIAFLGDGVVVVGAAGKEATLYRPDGTVMSRLAGTSVKVYPTAGLAVTVTSPAGSDPFAKGQLRVLAADGRVIFQRDLAKNENPTISGSATGVLLTTASGALQVVDRNGAVKDVAAGWKAASDDCNCDAPVSPLPVVYQEVGGQIVVGTVNPATGNLLWARSMFADRAKGRPGNWYVRVTGVGTKVLATYYQLSSDSSGANPTELWDAFTADGGALLAFGDVIGTDGQRVLITDRSRRLFPAVANKPPDFWSLSLDGTARAAGGGAYVGNGRVI
ncbi:MULTISPECIES: serine/threonine-protein kinase [Tsukamurella]|uniref:non-specific serine/threonine protein kinase n=2 Tax=Tsukamurella TaxID=2060 RepID=A0A846WXY8_9ACTN|nr:MULTISPECIES: serine/threonine-protein kinase [Tsukamurella]KXP03459.1 hypothetical protein AXK60_16690 [Tsukamurella pseudospumae]NKY17226.1 protein kinase [Tsukamurella spumae]